MPSTVLDLCHNYQKWSRGPNVPGQGQGPTFREQTLSRPRTGMLEAKDQEERTQRASVLKKKKKKLKKRSSRKKLKIFREISGVLRK